jgi:hypothetical protein
VFSIPADKVRASQGAFNSTYKVFYLALRSADLSTRFASTDENVIGIMWHCDNGMDCKIANNLASNKARPTNNGMLTEQRGQSILSSTTPIR